jgi:hypothetical protein
MVPLIFISKVAFAMRVSYGVVLVILFIGGYRLGRHTGGVNWRTRLAIAAV